MPFEKRSEYLKEHEYFRKEVEILTASTAEMRRQANTTQNKLVYLVGLLIKFNRTCRDILIKNNLTMADSASEDDMRDNTGARKAQRLTPQDELLEDTIRQLHTDGLITHLEGDTLEGEALNDTIAAVESALATLLTNRDYLTNASSAGEQVLQASWIGMKAIKDTKGDYMNEMGMKEDSAYWNALVPKEDTRADNTLKRKDPNV